MASHFVARTIRNRTEEQKAQELDKIAKYRELEEEVRSNIAKKNYTPEVFQLTSRLLRLNPEYYTIWNVRRRLLISGLLSARSPGSWPSRASPSTSPSTTPTPSGAASSSSSSTATPPAPAPPTAGRSGTTADTDSAVSVAAGGDEGGGSAPKDSAENAAAAQNDLEILKNELGFTIPLLMEFPKCYWIWNYRSWLLQEAIKRLDVPVARRIWEEELGLVSKMLTKDRRNFHAWGYRREVVKQLESAVLNGKSMVESEFEYTSKMIHVDLSNFSAWHNRSKLIPRLLDERGADDPARKSFLDKELDLIREALNVGPEDQSLWYYHQFLMLNLFEPEGESTITPRLGQEDRVTYVNREIDDIKDLLEDYDDSQLIYEALIDYTLALCQLEGRLPSGEEKTCLNDWLAKLRELDPMRNGRWDDLERDSTLASK